MSSITDEKARIAIRAWIEQQFEELDRQSYYHLLQLPQNAFEEQIRDAYYRMVARLHPDLYVESLDLATRQKLVTIYSRMVEGYRVLSDGKRREQYDRGLSQGRLRVVAEEEKVTRKDPAGEIKNPNAKRFFKLGQDALRAGDGKSAAMNLKFALSQEPDNELIKQELAKAEQLLRGGR